VLQQVAYLISDVSDGEGVTAAVDALGLLAGLGIVVGTVVTWRAAGVERRTAVAA